MALPRTASLGLTALALMLPAACGAGIVTGGIVGSRNNNDPTPEVRPPELSLPEPTVPLVPSEGEGASLRTVVVSNLELPATASLQVEIRALGVRAVQGTPAILSGQGTTTVIGYLLTMAPIVQALGDPTGTDVIGELAVLADGVEVAPPVPILLLRQPVAGLEPPVPGQAEQFLSPQGGTRVTLRLTGLRAERASDLLMSVATPDLGGLSGRVFRPCTNLTMQALPGSTAVLVAADVPGNLFPGQATLIVDDAIAGRSTPVTDVYYRPDVLTALPRQGPTTGGTLLTMIGRALAPLDFSVVPPAPDFDRVRIRFRKGGRELELDRSALRRAESSLDRLVFTMPPSPNGRPGKVDIVLEADLGTVLAEVTAADVFTFANPQPVFGPRGAALDRRPVASVPIRLEGAPGGDDAPDFAFLFEEGGVSFVQLFVAAENGMFSRFSAPRQIGDPQVPSEFGPVAIGAGDFDGDRVPDLIVINQGAGTTAVHQVILGQPAPLPPLGPAAARLTTIAGNDACRTVDLDGDGLLDLVLLPGVGAAPGSQPQVFLSRPVGIGQPAFAPAGTVPVRPGPYDAMTVADLDGDGAQDAVVVTGGATPRLDIAYGLGDGTFASGPLQQLDLAIPNYTPNTVAPAAGVHACGGAFPRSLAVVMTGLRNSGATPPLVATLHSGSPRTYAQPVPGDVLVLPATDPIGTTLAPDLDNDGIAELVLGVQGDTASVPLGVLGWQGTAFAAIANAVDSGAEQLLSISALHFGTAFPPDPVSGRNEVRAVFVVHESEVDGFRERRLSTMLVASGPSLLAPDAGGQVNVPILGHVGGVFSQIAASTGGSTADLALGVAGGVRLLRNDGAGGFFGSGPSLNVATLRPQTLTEVAVPAISSSIESLAFLTDDGVLGVWNPEESAARMTPDLRGLSPAPGHATTPVSAASRICSADVDGDGVGDLIVLLVFEVPAPGEGDALLLLLRGKAALQPGEFPFFVPVSGAVATAHGNSSDLAVGDFAPVAGNAALEVAVAVPRGTGAASQDGNHVRFYRYAAGATPEQDVLRPSFADPAVQNLLGGDEPVQVEAADFDGNGTVDLLIASSGDSSLHLFLNNGAPGSDPREVNIAAFQESLTSPKPLAPGRPAFLNLGDVNGDRIADALVTTADPGPPRSTAVAFYLSTGTGDFSLPTFLSPTRFGDRDAVMTVDLDDYNGDGQLDLSAVWSTAGTGDRNVRVLFGGSR